MLRRSEGTTPSERYLARLCDRTFLSLWSYPNVFRDQGQRGAGCGKEVCDLLVVFGNDVIIFSDKSCEFPDCGNLQLDWSRWYKRAIEKSAKQLFGAKRWIRKHLDRLFLDESCGVSFPFRLPHANECRFHLVAVALGAMEKCRESIAGSGSFVLCPEIKGRRHVGDDCLPFYVGDIDPLQEFVHVIDDVTLDVIFDELDTVGDFVDYLSKKENFIRAEGLALAEGEENLVAHYVSTMIDGEHGFAPTDSPIKLFVLDGTWQRHRSSPERSRKVAANEQSFLWDEIIEECTHHTIHGTTLPGSVRDVAQFESGARIMAAERRTSRRSLANALIHRVRTAIPGKASIRTVLSDDTPNLAYVFIATPDRGDEADHRTLRREYLSAYCFVLAAKHRHLRTVVGIATESGTESDRSYDFAIIRPSEWTDEAVADAAKLQKQLKILHDENLTTARIHEDEYPKERRPVKPMSRRFDSPEISAVSRSRTRRNARCPCGSGKKFKRCCMRN